MAYALSNSYGVGVKRKNHNREYHDENFNIQKRGNTRSMDILYQYFSVRLSNMLILISNEIVLREIFCFQP